MTLDGTNTWILREPGASGRSWSTRVRPTRRTCRPCWRRPATVGLILFTHRHFDHTEALGRFVELTGAPARSIDPEFTRGAEPLVDGETIVVDGLEIEVIATPDTRPTRRASGSSRTARCSAATRSWAAARRSSRTPTASSGPTSTRWRTSASSSRRGWSRASCRVTGRSSTILVVSSTSTSTTVPSGSTRCAQRSTPARRPRVRSSRRSTGTSTRVLWGAAELSVAAQLDYLKD